MKTLRKWWGIIRNQKHPFRFLIARLLMRTRISRFILLKRGRYSIRFYPSSALSAAIWVRPESRQRTERFFRDYLKDGDTVVDIGANIGNMTLEAAISVGINGKVFSIEPHPRTFKYLEGNLRLNQITNVRAFNVAMGDKDGRITFSDKSDDSNNSVVDDGYGIEIPVRRLDALDIDEEGIALVKIDTEGYEKYVLKGGEKTLRNTQCVYFESADTFYENFGYSSPAVFEILSKYGFEVFELTPTNMISKISESHTSTKKEDLVAVRNVDEFLERTGGQLAIGKDSG